MSTQHEEGGGGSTMSPARSTLTRPHGSTAPGALPSAARSSETASRETLERGGKLASPNGGSCASCQGVALRSGDAARPRDRTG